MKVSLEGRVALVTGASRGIGRAIALALAEAGADVAVNYRREAEQADEVVAQIKAMGRKAVAYAAADLLIEVDDAEMTDEQVGHLNSIAEFLAAAKGEQGVRAEAAAARADTVAATPAAPAARPARAASGAPAQARPRRAAARKPAGFH